MAITGNLKVYPGRTFTAQDFAVLMERISIIKSGIISGCTVTATASSVDISAGYAVVRGRLVQIPDSVITTIVPTEDFYVVLSVNLTTGVASVDATTELEADTEDFNTSTEETVVAYLSLATVRVSESTYTVEQELGTDEGQIKEFTIPASAWVAPENGNYLGYYYAITDNRITSTSHQEVLPPVNPTEAVSQALALADLHDGGQIAGQMVLVCYGVVPRTTVTLRVLFRGAI